MPTLLDGPRLNAKSGKARQLVVFLHGYGADGRDLIDIGKQWQDWLPDAVFVAPDAPEPCGQSALGRQWFELTFRDPGERWRGVNAAQPALDLFLDTELARHGIAGTNLALVGFSQGTMMALHTGLRREVQPAAIVGYSGLLVGPEQVDEASIPESGVLTPPVLLIHGDADQVIPVDALFHSTGELAKADIPCEWHLSLGVGHGIDPSGLRHGGLFLLRRFGLPYPKA